MINIHLFDKNGVYSPDLVLAIIKRVVINRKQVRENTMSFEMYKLWKSPYSSTILWRLGRLHHFRRRLFFSVFLLEKALSLK